MAQAETDKVFLSTLPARGATVVRFPARCGDGISIHAPRKRSDGQRRPPAPPGERFLSTLPARGATRPSLASLAQRQQFLSTLPARGATLADEIAAWEQKFLSTLPARGATQGGPALRGQDKISIHAPRKRSDASGLCRPHGGKDFYPRSPQEERR